jgi:hypothetical protein
MFNFLACVHLGKGMGSISDGVYHRTDCVMANKAKVVVDLNGSTIHKFLEVITDVF